MMVSGTVKSINNQASRSPETATGSARGIPPASTFPSTSVQSVSGTMAKPYAFATLLTADEYLPGCLTCVHSLKDTQSTAVPDGPDAVEYETVCLVTQETVSVEAVKQVKTAFDTLLFVDAIQSCSLKELALLGRPELKYTLTKLHLFRLVQYQRIIYLDADTLVIQPLSHLFTHSSAHPLSAAPDVGWPDAFNSGFMMLSPDQRHYDGLMAMAQDTGSWDGGDQGLLNDYFENNWDRLSFTYNVTPSSCYQYAPAMRRYGHSIKVIHFIGANKPWNRLHRDRPSPSTSLDDVHSYGALVSLWFDVFERHYGQRSTASLIDKSPSSQRPQADFHVPQYTNAWASSADVGYQPPDPADLQSMFGKRSQILDQYSAQGFKPDGQYRAPSPPPGYSTHDTLTATSELPALSSPTAHTQQSAPMASPPKSPWDAAHEEPDKTHMQMEHPMDHHYDNAWDLNTRESNLFFKVPTYQAVPSSIQQNYASVMQHSRGPPSAIFPWEDASTPSRLQPTRIFPEETTPQPARDAASSPPLLALTLSSPSPSQRRSVEASANSAPAQVLGGLPRDLGFKNAWDAIPSIKQKVNRSWPMSDEFFYPRDPESRLTAQDYRSLQRRQSESDSSSTAHDGDDEDEDEDEDAETARVLASMKQRPSFGTQFNRKPLKLLMNRGSPIQNTVPLPTPDVDAPPHMPGNLLSVHRRRISLTETSTRGQGPRHRSFRSPLPSLGVKPSSQGLPNPVAKRVFHPATDTNVIKKEGEAAYNRYINILETKGQTESQARRSSIKSPLVSAPSNPPSILA